MTQEPDAILKMSPEVLGKLSVSQSFRDAVAQLSAQEKEKALVVDYVEELRQTYGDLTGVEWYEVDFQGAEQWQPLTKVLPGINPPPFTVECHHVQATYYEFCRWEDHPWAKREITPAQVEKTYRPSHDQWRRANFDHQWAVEELDSKGWVPFRKMETTELLDRLHRPTSFLSLLEADLYAREKLYTLKESLAETFSGPDLEIRQFEVMKALVELETWE